MHSSLTRGRICRNGGHAGHTNRQVANGDHQLAGGAQEVTFDNGFN
jgi:hypothetical protein